MQYVLYALYVYFLTAINAGVFPAITIYGGIPQLMVVTCTILAVTEDDTQILFFVSLVGGFFWELFTGLLPGSLMLGYLLAGSCIYVLSRRVFFLQDRVKYLPLFLVVFHVCTMLWSVGLNVMAFRLGMSDIALQLPEFFKVSASSFMYNLLLLYPVYILLAQIERLRVYFARQRSTIP